VQPNAHYSEYNEDLPLRKFTGGIIVLQYWYLRDALNFRLANSFLITSSMEKLKANHVNAYI